MGRFRRDAAAVLALIALAAAVSAQSWTTPVRWVPDALFYQQHLLQFRGVSHDEAQRRAFALVTQIAPGDVAFRENLMNREWIERSEPFYNRRRALPAAGAAIYPLAGDRSLLILSLLAYVLIGPATYLLLRLRFARITSAGVAAGVLLFPPLMMWSAAPLTDSTSVLLLELGLAGAFLTVTRGLRWLPAWIVPIGLLSVTRESYVALIVTAAVLAIMRMPRTRWLFASSVAAVAPATLLLPTPSRRFLATGISDNAYSPDLSLAGFASNWLNSASNAFEGNSRHPFELTLIVIALVLLVRASRHDMALRVFAAYAVGATVFLGLLPKYTGLRLDLVLVPALAGGLAVALERRIHPFWRQYEPEVASIRPASLNAVP